MFSGKSRRALNLATWESLLIPMAHCGPLRIQGKAMGLEVCYQPRAFDPESGAVTLKGIGTSKFQPDAGTKYLWGWVDVDALFQREQN